MDCFVTDPADNVLYNEKKKQFDNFSHTTTMKGIYKVCFSNEFSTYTHKTVYLHFRHGGEQPLLESMSRVTALTQVCKRMVELNPSIHFRNILFSFLSICLNAIVAANLMSMLKIHQCVKYYGFKSMFGSSSSVFVHAGAPPSTVSPWALAVFSYKLLSIFSWSHLASPFTS